MATKIKTPETGDTINAPSVSANPNAFVQETSFLEGLRSTAVPAAFKAAHNYQVKEKLRNEALQKKQEEDSAAKVVNILSNKMDQFNTEVAEGANPQQVKIAARNTMAKELVNSKVPSEYWPKVTGLFSPIITEIGAEYHTTVDGVDYTKNSSGGVTVTAARGALPSEHLIEAAIASMPATSRGMFYEKTNESKEAGLNYLHSFYASQEELDDMNFKQKVNEYKKSQLQLDKELKSNSIPKTKATIYKFFSDNVIHGYADDLVNQVKLGELKSDEALKLFDSDTSHFMTEGTIPELMMQAKLSPADIQSDIQPWINAIKEEIKFYASDTRDKQRLAELEVDRKIKKEVFLKGLNPQTALFWENGTNLYSAFSAQAVAKSLGATSDFNIQIQKGIIEVGKYKEQIANKLTPEDEQGYFEVVKDTINDATILNETGDVNQVPVASLYNICVKLKEHPQFSVLKEKNPEVAAYLKSVITQLKPDIYKP